jgi:hypothetical protein
LNIFESNWNESQDYRCEPRIVDTTKLRIDYDSMNPDLSKTEKNRGKSQPDNLMVKKHREIKPVRGY